MPFVLAKQNNWTEEFRFEIQNTFKNLRDGVNHAGNEDIAPTDAFMWEVFTTKKYYDNGEVKQIGHIYTPWPSWVISASTDLTGNEAGKKTIQSLLLAINEGIAYFNKNHSEAVEYITGNLDYSAQDASAWIETVTFADDVSKVDQKTVISNTVNLLQSAGVLDAKAESADYLSLV
ncbi:hypothetical protein AWJ20_4067 [Sugiyamaella lignohabitans]|uniref:Ca3427-like PBP 2 domain-containing protein n=1 Tax=Sugiyamaella lignohabitans TaxID=796027 RepID=A0A167C616_9ASCO|nr:uncharacterized protein AWJ20_4067 [Sugiyamaella lignohabitans]ANB11264.1 hypothetical protein AWJ20_4067 [Sugiyamaella lignohabitans]